MSGDERTLTVATATMLEAMPARYSEEDRKAAVAALLEGTQWNGVPEEFPEKPERYIAWAGNNQIKVYRHMHGYRAVGGNLYEVCVTAEKGGYYGSEQFTAEEVATIPVEKLWSCYTTSDEQLLLWRYYYTHVSRWGDDYADQLNVPEAQYVVTTWRVTIEESEAGLVIIEGGRYHPTNHLAEHLAPREFPGEVRGYLMMAADRTDNFVRAREIRTLNGLRNIPGTSYRDLMGGVRPLGQLTFSVPERFYTKDQIEAATRREAMAALERLGAPAETRVP